MTKHPTIIFAGDRALSVRILQFILEKGCRPAALMVPALPGTSHAKKLIALCKPFLPSDRVFVGVEFKSDRGIKHLQQIAPDYIIGIHFPYLIPKPVLDIPKRGFLNLHPAFLPYNRGWHTPSWAIFDDTPYGATLHLMAEQLDAGNILVQKRLPIAPDDTADSLYKKALELEYHVFVAFWPKLLSGRYTTIPQDHARTTAHNKSDLETLRRIDPKQRVSTDQLLRRLRALTTNRLEEAAYFEHEGVRYRVQIAISPEHTPKKRRHRARR